jgi:outer membrane biosynthesis protein TonB
MPDAAAVAALGTQTMPQREHRAESLAFTGARAARATLTFEVSLDERGKPTRCTVIKHSGRASLDAAVCNAVMRAR